MALRDAVKCVLVKDRVVLWGCGRCHFAKAATCRKYNATCGQLLQVLPAESLKCPTVASASVCFMVHRVALTKQY